MVRLRNFGHTFREFNVVSNTCAVKLRNFSYTFRGFNYDKTRVKTTWAQLRFKFIQLWQKRVSKPREHNSDSIMTKRVSKPREHNSDSISGSFVWWNSETLVIHFENWSWQNAIHEMYHLINSVILYIYIYIYIYISFFMKCVT